MRFSVSKFSLEILVWGINALNIDLLNAFVACSGSNNAWPPFLLMEHVLYQQCHVEFARAALDFCTYCLYFQSKHPLLNFVSKF